MKWEEPSATSAGRPARQDWAAIASELRANPRRWAVIDTDTGATATSNLRAERNRHFRPSSDWEFASRGWDASTHRYAKLYGRYIGEQVSS